MKIATWLAIVLTTTTLLTAQTVTNHWTFNGTLEEAQGGCPFFTKQKEIPFETVDGRKLLRVDSASGYTTNDSFINRLQPGMRFSMRIKLDHLQVYGSGWPFIIQKSNLNANGGYGLRIDQSDEGNHFSLFVNTDGNPEPRVRSKHLAKPGVWYDIEGGWDGKYVWLSVNGDMMRTPRIGAPNVNYAPLRVGPFEGVIADLIFHGSDTAKSVVANWKPQQSTQDTSSYKHHLLPCEGTSTLDPKLGDQSSAPKFKTPSTDDLATASGYSIQTIVTFDKMPTSEHVIIGKNNEYLLRYDVNKKTNIGVFNFFRRVPESGWEPRVSCRTEIELGKKYHVTASYENDTMYLQVNGNSVTKRRIGITNKTDSVIELGAFPGKIHSVIIENPRPSLPVIHEAKITELLPREGDTFHLQAKLTNIGTDSKDVSIVVDVPKVFGGGEIKQHIGELKLGQTIDLKWPFKAITSAKTIFRIKAYVDGNAQYSQVVRVAVLPKKDVDRSAKAWNPNVSGSACFYIDARDGNDKNDGKTPETAWKSFDNINGKTLQPGQRLLLKRGSVFNQELIVKALGTEDNWAEIAAYGEGPRPTIRRNRMLNERCMFVERSSYLVIRDLIVCNAGKGIDILLPNKDYRGILVENCLAHHIEGTYRYNSHGIPEWRDMRAAAGGASGGISISASWTDYVTLRDCEMYQCSVAYRVTGDNAFVDRIFCHDNFSHNTSPHPVMASVYRSILQNSIFDASGWNASAGTMGIMYGFTFGFITRNCYFMNQPDSGSHDEGGIDFECDGEGNLVEHCTFRNNAGAAIEVLGLRTPQTRNIHIRNNRFDKNNVANKLGPSEIFVWGGTKDRSIVCSNGLIENNGYVLNENIQFYVNKATPTHKDWILKNNTQYATAEEMAKAMPFNEPPVPIVMDEIWTDNPTVQLTATVKEDGLPNQKLALQWLQNEGPAIVAFNTPDKLNSTATFPIVGDYRIQLKADDGEFWRTSRTAVHILPKGRSVSKAWTFAKNLDAEGWTANNLGTTKEHFRSADSFWDTFSLPVNLACGDYYVFAMKQTNKPFVLSPENLNVKADATRFLTLKLHNKTNAKLAKVEFITDENPQWNDNASLMLQLKPQDIDDSTYTLDLAKCPAWKGNVKQLKLTILDGDNPITGTWRIDYITLGN